MNVLRFTDRAFATRIREMSAQSSLFDPKIEERTRASSMTCAPVVTKP
jgi:hypothetical protein